MFKDFSSALPHLSQYPGSPLFFFSLWTKSAEIVDIEANGQVLDANLRLQVEQLLLAESVLGQLEQEVPGKH